MDDDETRKISFKNLKLISDVDDVGSGISYCTLMWLPSLMVPEVEAGSSCLLGTCSSIAS